MSEWTKEDAAEFVEQVRAPVQTDLTEALSLLRRWHASLLPVPPDDLSLEDDAAAFLSRFPEVQA